MNHHVVLITGTPCTGKTTIAKELTAKLDALYINLTDYTKTNNLTLGEDSERKTTIIDEEATLQKLSKTIEASDKSNIIVDGHYASVVVPTKFVSRVFVLRRNPKELKQMMEKRGYVGTKLWENLQAEIIDVCLVEAVQAHAGKVCELDITGKTVEQVICEILDVLDKRKPCLTGIVDWLGILEAEGITDQYLKM